MEVEFRLLGAVEVAVCGEPVRLGPRGERFVLAVLALEANRVVPTDRLVELSWPDRPPRTAVHAIQVAVHRLRTTLADAGAERYRVRLATRCSGYLLELDPMRVDAHRFRALVRQSRDLPDPSRAMLLREALGLWRGPALAGTDPAGTAGVLGHGLAEARLLAIEDLMDACLRLHRHREVVDELTDLVRAHPSRERPVGQLMLALHRDGRSAAALELYDRTRRHLSDEFGIAPGAELRRLQLSILRDEDELRSAEIVRDAC